MKSFEENEAKKIPIFVGVANIRLIGLEYFVIRLFKIIIACACSVTVQLLFFQYYFGDANLLKDKFLNEEMKKDDGWVTLQCLLTFNRLKSMSEDPAVIMTALRKSSDDLLEVR